MSSLRIGGLHVVYSGESGKTVALEDVRLQMESGESVAILGPSGCGKTTLLLVTAGLLAPTAGEVLVGGAPVEGPRRATSLILQNSGLFPWKRVHDNAGLGLVLRGMSRRDARSKALVALDEVGIAEFARAYPKELSEGMRQRLALARAITLEADLLLMDEPLASLDAITREVMQEYLLELWLRRRHTQLLVTHSIEEAAFLGRRVCVMSPRPGRVSSVFENPGMGAPGYRQSIEFHEICTALREALAGQGSSPHAEVAR